MSDVNVTAADAGELLQLGATRMHVLEDGSRTDHRIGATVSVLPPGVPGPPPHRHLMHDETFLITGGVVRFSMGDTHRDARVGDYVVVPIGAPHTFANLTDAPATVVTSFTPAFYVDYFRELAQLSAQGRLTPEETRAVMLRYATVPADGAGRDRGGA
jgi:quercetin dioxygenase-like cupin family protein